MKYTENYIEGNTSYGVRIEPKGVVLHHNYLPKDILIRQMTERNSFKWKDYEIPPASYHCVGWEDGSRTSFAKDHEKAWHAGKSEFKGIAWCNNYMLGYSFHINTNAEPLTNNQIESFIEWLIPRIEVWDIKKEWVVTHMMVSPGRKTDISEKEYKRILSAIKYLWL